MVLLHGSYWKGKLIDELLKSGANVELIATLDKPLFSKNYNLTFKVLHDIKILRIYFYS